MTEEEKKKFELALMQTLNKQLQENLGSPLTEATATGISNLFEHSLTQLLGQINGKRKRANNGSKAAAK